MSDPRTTPFNGRVAHSSLKGKVAAETFTDGVLHRVNANTADLKDVPQGNRQCQLLYGELFRVLDEDAGHAFGVREADGYVGWIPKLFIVKHTLSVFEQTELKVIVPQAVAMIEPDIKSHKNYNAAKPLPFGSTLWHRPFNDAKREEALRQDGWFCTIRPTINIGTPLYLRWSHVAPADQMADDPATIAELFLHVPYVWGGDSSFGIDCSGLVQRALHACGKPCPRDSDMQHAFFDPIDEHPHKRGDLIFWKGHVGMMLDDTRLIHANAHHMMVAIEPLANACARISQKEFGEVLGRARP